MSHILIVDDEPSICWGFRELLTDEGHDVTIASSAEEAVMSIISCIRGGRICSCPGISFTSGISMVMYAGSVSGFPAFFFRARKYLFDLAVVMIIVLIRM